MKRLACLICLLVLAACSRGPDSDFKELPVAEGGFSVLMRPQPNVARQQLDTPGGRVTAHLYSSERPDSYFAVGYSDYPAGLVLGSSPESLFAGVRDTWVKRLNGKLLSSGPIRLKQKDHPIEYQGLEFTAEGKVKDIDTHLHARVYLVDQRLYQVIAMARKAEFPQATVNTFLNSFKLIPTAEIGTIQVEPAGK